MKNRIISTFAATILTALTLPSAMLRADVLFNMPAATSGATILSAYWGPDGSAWDERIWDSFTLATAGDVTELRWRGGYGGQLPGGSRNITDFEISIWATIPAGGQPDVGGMFGGQLLHYLVTDRGQPGNAGETPAGTIGGVAMYDYHSALPRTFRAVAGTQYWVQIIAWQPSFPNWGLARATGGNGSHFARVPAVTGDFTFINAAGDAAFSLIGTPAACTAPVITVNPLPFSACWSYGGPSISLTAAASGGGPFTYRWKLNGSPVYDGPNGGGTGGGALISGATTATLSIAGVSYYHDVGTYTCQISNACGSSTTAGALVDVPYGRDSVTASPASRTLCPGAGTTLIAGFTNLYPSTRGWSRNGVALTDGTTPAGTVISGSATATLSLANFQAADSGSFSCSISNPCGSSSTVPATVTATAGCSPADLPIGGLCPDGIVDGSDYIAFINSFSTGDIITDSLADVNTDGTIDGSDFIEFINAFAVGC
jgi:hypothetical protein